MLNLLFLIAAVSDIGYGEISATCKGRVIQAEATACAWDSYHRADAEMNEVWRSTRSDRSAGNDVEAALLKSQRAFLIYREQTCKVPYLVESPGTIAPMEQANCLTEITIHRVAELRKLFK